MFYNTEISTFSDHICFKLVKTCREIHNFLLCRRISDLQTLSRRSWSPWACLQPPITALPSNLSKVNLVALCIADVHDMLLSAWTGPKPHPKNRVQYLIYWIFGQTWDTFSFPYRIESLSSLELFNVRWRSLWDRDRLIHPRVHRGGSLSYRGQPSSCLQSEQAQEANLRDTGQRQWYW